MATTNKRSINRRHIKGEMARSLVYFCLRMLMATTIWAMVITTIALLLDRSIDLTAVLTFVGASFGGELLLLLVKRMFAKPNTEEENHDGPDTLN